MRISDWSSDVCSSDLCAPSIAAWARLAAISSSHNRLSMGIEAFISCMIAAGPPPKRPPHMLLLSGESAIRRVPNSKIAILALLLAGSVAGCDREKHRAEQAEIGRAAGRERVCKYVTN